MNFERAPLRLMAVLSSTLLTAGIALADAPINAVAPAENRAVAAKVSALTPPTSPFVNHRGHRGHGENE